MRSVVAYCTVILSWGNSATRRLFETGKSRFRGLDVDAALELLTTLHAAERLNHISPLKSVGLHPLKGNRRGQWAITVNGPWRICFQFRSGNAYGVEIVDYH
jgi:proteic killer suppression protein